MRTQLTALITGASGGIGVRISRALAADGYRIIAVGRDEERLSDLCDAVHTSGGECTALSCDLGNPAAIEALLPQVRNLCTSLDVLVNNAGTADTQPLSETSLESWNHHMQVNATAPFLLSTGLLELLIRAAHPTIINIGSVVSYVGYEGQGAYAASKHALLGLTRVMAREYQAHGIRVHIVAPGGTATDMVQRMRPDLDLDGMITPEEVAGVVLDLTRMKGNAVIDEVRIRRAGGTPFP